MVIFGEADGRNAWDTPVLGVSKTQVDNVVTPASGKVDDNGSAKDILEELTFLKDELSLSLENTNSPRDEETTQHKKEPRFIRLEIQPLRSEIKDLTSFTRDTF